MRLVVSCIDRRLNAFLEKNYGDGETIFVRTAGANVNSLGDTAPLLKQASKIIIVTHSDCGAIGVVHKALNEGPVPDEVGKLVNPFLKYAGLTRPELEELNSVVQENLARQISAADVQTEFVRTEKLDARPSGSIMAVITQPSSLKYSEMLPGGKVNDAFIVQNLGQDRALDILILRKFLGVSNLIYL